MIVHPRFLNEFDAFFDADVIAIDDRARMLSDAALLADTIAAWPDARTVQHQLTDILNKRDADDVRQFIRTTRVDWYSDTTIASLLFDILAVIRNQLARRS